ncbi:kinase-like domain-containing protein, partial [Mycena latifolia]
DHIIRYVDQYVHHDAGILHILMEYCGGGDLSAIIKRAVKQNVSIPEDAVRNSFIPILVALKYCHNTGEETEREEGRVQIFHRDLKPEVFCTIFSPVRRKSNHH